MLSGDIQERLEKKIEDGLVQKDREKKTEKDIFNKNKVISEGLDKSTIMTLSGMINDGTLSYVNGAAGSGKESKIYWGVDPSCNDLAIKIYLVTTSNFKKKMQYLIGDHRFTRMKKRTRNMVALWTRKEFDILNQCLKSGIPCVKLITVNQNVVVLEFVGKDGVASPTLVEAEVDHDDYENAVKIISDLYRRAKIVHADLSEHNIFKTDKGLVLFDFGSAVDIRHPNAKEFLERDIRNITKFFVKRGLTVENPIDVFERLIK